MNAKQQKTKEYTALEELVEESRWVTEFLQGCVTLDLPNVDTDYLRKHLPDFTKKVRNGARVLVGQEPEPLFEQEVKFRAWNYTTQKMSVEPIGLHSAYCYIPSCKLMQYTGFKDEHSKDIYDCDIILSSSPLFIEPVVLRVYIYHPNWPGTIMAVSNDNHCPLVDAMPCEVIGNTFEHPELLR